VPLLSTIRDPCDVKALAPAQLTQLAAEVRDFLVAAVSKTGGHLGSNLGVVELSIALHRVFESPRDPLLFDVGHQAYVHKILTGRQAGFATLRQGGGLSGYPNRRESEHDVIENSHASTALSYADGLAKAFALRGQHDRRVVAVVGDGALTGGMCWEALNNIAAGPGRPVVIVVNDNGRSYDPTAGALAEHLADLRMRPDYELYKSLIKAALPRVPLAGLPLYEAFHRLKKGLKDVVAPQPLFEDLGLKYLGPINGHDIAALEAAFTKARDFGAPVIVHCITRKGFGYQPALHDAVDRLHGVGAFDAVTGAQRPGTRTWDDVVGEEMVALARGDPALVAVTAAMTRTVNLAAMAAEFPDRVFDVGIAEQHAVTHAAGLAMGGLKPVVCLYATFLNRAFDQLLMDVALHRQPVTFILNRAGVTGPDGPSHHGMWDLSSLQLVPGIALAAPRDASSAAALLRACVQRTDGPSVIRFPKAPVGPDISAVESRDGVDVLARAQTNDVLLVGVGAMAATALKVAERTAAHGVGVDVVDPGFLLPVNPALVAMAGQYHLVATIEDGIRVGGVGARIALELADAGLGVPVRVFGLPARFLDHGARADLLCEHGLSDRDIADAVVDALDAAAMTPAPPRGGSTASRQHRRRWA
jgi:1-deoxy-D-xylulose-5-phosphate synthase